MKVSEDAWTKEEFRNYAERMSKYFDLKGCRTEKCINDRISNKDSKRLNVLVEHDFARHLIRESWLHPHPVYKEILGFSDEEYDESRASVVIGKYMI